MPWSRGQVFFKMEIALFPSAADGGLWDQALWDEGIWAGNLPEWVELTNTVYTVTASMGAEKWGTRFRDGNATFTVDNSTGNYNPDFGADIPGELSIRPGRWIRLSANAGEGWIPIFTGTIDQMSEQYDQAGDNITTLLYTTGFGALLGVNNPPALITPVGGGDFTGERVNRLLDSFNWYVQARDVQAGSHTMQSSAFARTKFEELQRAGDAEGSGFWFDGRGFAVFKDKDWLTTDPRSINPVMLPGSEIPGQPQVIAVESDWAAGRVVNDIQLARTGGTSVRVENTTSQSLYGRRSYQRFDYEVENDTQVLSLANQLLGWREYDKLSIDEITLWDGGNIDAARLMIETLIGDHWLATVTTNRGWGYTVPVNVARIDWRITADDWFLTCRVVDRTIGAPPGTKGAFSDGFSDGFLIDLSV